MTRSSMWICPTLCGCALRETHTFGFKERAVPLHPLMQQHLAESGQFDAVIITREIIAQCPDHAAFSTVDALWEELRHFHGNAHRPDTCGCSIVYCWDDRVAAEKRVHAPMDHPVHTIRCADHADLSDAAAHHDAVVAENVHKNLVVNQIAKLTGVDAAQVPFRFTADRDLVIDATALGIDPAVVDHAIATVVVEPGHKAVSSLLPARISKVQIV